jgi:hypothetical protein
MTERCGGGGPNIEIKKIRFYQICVGITKDGLAMSK